MEVAKIMFGRWVIDDDCFPGLVLMAEGFNAAIGVCAGFVIYDYDCDEFHVVSCGFECH